MTDAALHSRRSERLRVTLHARCTVAGDDETPPVAGGVTLVNITPEGCCMTTGGTPLKPGTAVIIRLETGEALTGQVRWCNEVQAGILFDHYLPAARVEYLRREHSTFLSEADQFQGKVQRPAC